MSKRLSRFFAGALLAVTAASMLAVSFDAEARRFGGGRSFGQQSPRVTQQQRPATPPAAANTQRSATAPATAAAAGTAAAGTAARSGMSRFLGPIMGIAAGLGIAALLSHLGLSGAFLEMMSSLVLIALVIFAIMFIVRRFRGAQATATQAAGAGGMRRQGLDGSDWQRPATPPAAPVAAPVAAPAAAQAPQEGWFIPGDFDTAGFLANAKKQFVAIQGIWDRGDVDQLGDYLTDDLIAEFRPQIQAREGRPEHTEVVLLNAELLGIEEVAGGHLASVRYSGMLREAPGAEAFRFEEVWNLYKAENAGWLLAGIQQLPGEQAN